jgi:endoglucanase
MGRGINIGNTMEAAQEGNWQDPMEECYFDEYVGQGFQNVRIPIRWDGHTATTAPYTIDASWLDRVEEVIDWGLSKGLVIIINAHHEHWLLDDHSPTNIARFEAIWGQVADHFQNKSENLLFEIINEPYFRLTGTQVDNLNQNILNIIRVHNPSRIVLMTGGDGTSYEAPLNMAIPDDDFIMAYFHYYRPFSFTSGTVNNWGTASVKEAVASDFNEVESWA